MKIRIDKSDIKGVASIPPSKSLTIRALMCAALSKGESQILHPLISDDTKAAIDVLSKIGIQVTQEKDRWKVLGGKFRVPRDPLDCGESATTMRLLTAVMSLIPGVHKIVGGPTLSQRPMRSLTEALDKLGVKTALEGKTTPPVTITGGTFTGGETQIPGNISSQYISALLLIGPFSKTEEHIVLTTALTSKPYILMTIACLKKFGIKVESHWDGFSIKRQRYEPAKIDIEGDWSSASYFLALGALSPEGVRMDNLKTATLQGDRVMLDLLRNMGAMVRLTGNALTVSQGNLKAIQADFTDCIDLLPAMSVLAALGQGESLFIGVERARIKESNRVNAIKDGLVKLGVNVKDAEDRLVITGCQKPPKQEGPDDSIEEKTEEVKDEKPGPPVVIDSYGDHRIAMAFAIWGAAKGNIIIDGAECVAKTFPGFWDELEKVGVKIKRNVK